MKLSRINSLIVIFLIYILASAIGIISYLVLPFDFIINLLLADIIATIVVFIFSLVFNNASVYDPYWSVQPLVIVTAFAFNGPMSWVRLLPLISIFIWGIRLTLNWAYTFNSFEYQDWRYLMLKEKTGKFYPFINLMGIHMFPTIVVYLCMLPVAYIYHSTLSLNLFSIIFFIVSICATIIQGVADYQMHRFRKKKTGTLIREGLWKYSRHPNYLGEILMWWGVALYSVTNLGIEYWWLCFGAMINTLMFVFISIPMAEKHQSNRKPNYEQYKKETRMLLPFRK